jgi:hypothetical protein
MNHPLQCQCGEVKGYVIPSKAQRVVCYCKDCQAFARYLKREKEILDVNGGSDIVQTLPMNVVFTEGTRKLACMRLSDKGLLRWYADCCKTPIGNTAADSKFSFIGLIHNCLETAGKSVDASFGPIKARIHTQSATGNPKPRTEGALAAIFNIVGRLIGARISGNYKRTPFFDINRATPIVTPVVLTHAERVKLISTM